MKFAVYSRGNMIDALIVGENQSAQRLTHEREGKLICTFGFFAPELESLCRTDDGRKQLDYLVTNVARLVVTTMNAESDSGTEKSTLGSEGHPVHPR